MLQGYTRSACSNINPSISVDTCVYLIYLLNIGLNWCWPVLAFKSNLQFQFLFIYLFIFFFVKEDLWFQFKLLVFDKIEIIGFGFLLFFFGTTSI
jgi:hypothetical protein